MSVKANQMSKGPQVKPAWMQWLREQANLATAGDQPVGTQLSAEQVCHAPPVLLTVRIHPPEVSDTVIACKFIFGFITLKFGEKRKTTGFHTHTHFIKRDKTKKIPQPNKTEPNKNPQQTKNPTTSPYTQTKKPHTQTKKPHTRSSNSRKVCLRTPNLIHYKRVPAPQFFSCLCRQEAHLADGFL